MRLRLLIGLAVGLNVAISFVACDSIDRDAPQRFYVAPDADQPGDPTLDGGGGVEPDVASTADTSTPTDAPMGFSPATIPLTGWWRATAAGSPWLGVESVGTSTGRNLTEAVNPPAAGPALNGLTPLTFDGVNDQLSTALTVDSFIAPTSFSLVVLFRAEVGVPDPGDVQPYLLPGLFIGSGGTVAVPLISYSAAGVRAGFYDGTAWDSLAVAATAAAWHMAKLRYNGALLELGIDSGAMASRARKPVVGASAGLVRVGARDDQAAFFKGQIAELLVSRNAFTDADFANIKTYMNARYGLAL